MITLEHKKIDRAFRRWYRKEGCTQHLIWMFKARDRGDIDFGVVAFMNDGGTDLFLNSNTNGKNKRNEI